MKIDWLEDPGCIPKGLMLLLTPLPNKTELEGREGGGGGAGKEL
jgi:hypothetical protein